MGISWSWDRYEEGFLKGQTEGFKSGNEIGYGLGFEQGIVQSEQFRLGYNRGFGEGVLRGMAVGFACVIVGGVVYFVWRKYKKKIGNQNKIKQYSEAIAVVRQSSKINNPLQEDLKKLFFNPRQTDLTVEIKGGRNNDVLKFKTHKFILVARCPWFESQYHFEPTKNHYVIDLKDSVVPPDWWSTSDFEEVLYFLYTHQLRSTVSSSEDKVGILIIAHFLQLDALVTICEMKLVSLLSLDTLHHFFGLSHMLQLKLLNQFCDEFIRKLPQDVKDNTLKNLLL